MSGENDTLIRAASMPGDEARVLALWDDVLGATWPVVPHALVRQLLSGMPFVAERAGAVIGLVAAQHRATGASVAALLVERRERGRGVGTRLLATAASALRAQGAREINLGGPPGPYLWPGVPTNLEGAQRFFETRGAAFTETRTDMKLDLSSYVTPSGVMERAAAADVRFSVATPADTESILTFEATHFPRWLGSFEAAIENGRHDEVLLVRDARGDLVGTAMIERPDPAFVWDRLMPGAGQLGVVGVAEPARGRGIGLALSARGCEILADRGVRHVYLAWVWSPGWYAQLGFRVWRVYLRGALGVTRAAA